MSFPGCQHTGPVIPWTFILPAPLENLQLSSLGCISTGNFITWTSILPAPLEQLQMSSLGRVSTGFLIPTAPLLLQPLENVQSSQKSILTAQGELNLFLIFLLLHVVILLDFFEEVEPFLAHKRA